MEFDTELKLRKKKPRLTIARGTGHYTDLASVSRRPAKNDGGEEVVRSG
jgi:hypothetical protein